MADAMTRSAFRGGAHPPERKEATAGLPIEWAPVPDELVVPLSQHLGAPCAPLVTRGERVRRGQRIGDVEATISAPVHSPVDGEVAALTETLTCGGQRVAAVRILPDAEQNLQEWQRVDGSEDPRQRVRSAGIVGMGGATFPSVVKLKAPESTPVSTVILNGCECEPYLTCDHRLMLEAPERVIAGGRLICDMVGASRVIVAVESNKRDAIPGLEAVAGEGVEVRLVPTLYPQGAEKQLIWAVLRAEVPHGMLPAAAGALVHNVATAAAIADAIDFGKPLMERVVTVTGRVARPGNYRVLLGTLVSDLIEVAGGLVGDIERVIAGGPMTGAALGTLDVPITKGTSGIVALGPEEAVRRIDDDQPCIRCARCAEGCPMALQPYAIADRGYRRMWKDAEEFHPIDCIECGVCNYVCPTKRPLLQLIRLAKSAALARGTRT